MDKSQMACCGTYCGDCAWKEKTGCKGCQDAGGNMFWGECAVAKCAIEKKLVEIILKGKEPQPVHDRDR